MDNQQSRLQSGLRAETLTDIMTTSGIYSDSWVRGFGIEIPAPAFGFSTNPDADTAEILQARAKIMDLKPVDEAAVEQLILDIYGKFGVLPPKQIVWLDGPLSLKKTGAKPLNPQWGLPWEHIASQLARNRRWSQLGNNPLDVLGTADIVLGRGYHGWSSQSLLSGEQWAERQTKDSWQAIIPLFAELATLTSGFLFGQETVYLVRRPTSLASRTVGGRQRLHSINGPAVTWPNGPRIYMLDGVSFNYQLWRKIASGRLSPKQALAIVDVDQRSVAIKHLGPDKMIEALNAKVISRGLARHYKWDGRVISRITDKHSAVQADITTQNILYRTHYFNTPNQLSSLTNPPRYFLYYIDPSTGDPYISFCTEGVRQRGADADAVMAWKHHMTGEQYLAMVAEA